MPKKVRKIYIGAAWPYVNDLFHIGNLAGAYLPPDIFARFHKLSGNRVLMVSGSDFHGTPITIKAFEERVKPEVIAQKFHELDKEYLKKFGIDYTFYTSTHTDVHRKTVQDMFLRLMKKGYIKMFKTGQLYSEKSQSFLQDRYIEGECPYCHSKEARGDQCESCGRMLDAADLINPVSKIDRSRLTVKMTENYFLDLGKIQDALKKWLLARKEMRGWVKKESLGWIKEGLKPRAITRDMNYGVPLPIDSISKEKRIEHMERKVFYVWFEAVIGYLSAAIEYSFLSKNPDYWKEFFYNPKAETYYFVGQDNLVFHTINWPAQLIAFDKKINLPSNVFVNKFLFLEGRKMSKSRGWFIDTKYFIENYSANSLRFYLSLNLPEQKELNFTWEEFIGTNNSILVATVGNFVHRVLSLAKMNYGDKFDLSKASMSKSVEQRTKRAFSETAFHLDRGEFRQALQKIVDLASFGNQYVDKAKAWELVKKNPNKGRLVIQELLLVIDSLRFLLYPFIPESAEELGKLLGQPGFSFREGENQWQSKKSKKIKLAETIQPLFQKIDEGQIEIERQKLQK